MSKRRRHTPHVHRQKLKLELLGSILYRTLNGAHVGDIFMSLIHTAELNKVQPFDYLVELLRHHEEVAENPTEWMPWAYQETLARLRAQEKPPE